MDEKDKNPSYMHHKEDIIRTLDLIIHNTRSSQIVVVVVGSLSVQFALAGYQVAFEPS